MAVGAPGLHRSSHGGGASFAQGTFGLLWILHGPLIPAPFAGASMAATSIGITACVFSELQFLRTKEGQIVIGTTLDFSVLNPFDPANREGLIVAAILLMVIGTTFLAPVLLRLVISRQPAPLEQPA